MAWLSEAGCSMFEQSGDDLHAFAQESDLDPNELSDIQSKMEPLGLEQWQVNEVEDENWNAQWEADYPEVEIESLIRVSAPFHHRSEGEGFAHQLTIQPRMAFGTGHHETTRGLLTEMAQMDWQGQRVLDMGCGSGVLGIYASMRGASEVVLIDIDPWSVRNTEENLSLNPVSDETEHDVREGGASVLKAADAHRFDVVIANINRNILLEDFGAYVQVMAERSVLMLSGFMDPDVAPLVEAGKSHGLKEEGLRSEGEWRVLTLQR
jgi:ribosomal protein L11 methyltransferase